MPYRRALAAACLALVLTWALPRDVHAQPLPVRAQQSKPLSLAEAADVVRERVGGRVLAADVVWANGQTYYLIRVLVKKGRVKVYRVDPYSGRVF